MLWLALRVIRLYGKTVFAYLGQVVPKEQLAQYEMHARLNPSAIPHSLDCANLCVDAQARTNARQHTTICPAITTQKDEIRIQNDTDAKIFSPPKVASKRFFSNKRIKISNDFEQNA